MSVSAVSWSNCHGDYQLVLTGSGATLVGPGDFRVSLPAADWRALGAAIAAILPGKAPALALTLGITNRGPAAGVNRAGAGAWNAGSDGKLLKLWGDGLAFCDIVRDLGRTGPAVAARLVRLGAAPNRNFARERSGDTTPSPAYGSLARSRTRWSDDEERELRQAFQDGVPHRQIARRFQRSQAAIDARLTKLGLLPPAR